MTLEPGNCTEHTVKLTQCVHNRKRVWICVSKDPPELRVFRLDRDGLRNVKRVLKHKFKEFSRAECSVDGVCGGDGLAQHVNDALHFAALSIGLYQTQVLRVILPSPLKIEKIRVREY